MHRIVQFFPQGRIRIQGHLALTKNADGKIDIVNRPQLLNGPPLHKIFLSVGGRSNFATQAGENRPANSQSDVALGETVLIDVINTLTCVPQTLSQRNFGFV